MADIAKTMNLVIEYIENHLTEELDQDRIAKIAGCSFYDIGRLFSLISDISMSEYIRKRKLTLAGAELKYESAKIIDIALKYGYNSPVSFARAFQNFHGFNPSSAKRSDQILRVCPRFVFQICVKEVVEPMNHDTILINGKEYERSYFGECDMSSWSDSFCKRKYWRLENTGDDFENSPRTREMLPSNNYPPMNIEIGQVFMIDYYREDGSVEHKYYIADGTVWNDMPCTTEFIPVCMQPIRKETLNVCGKNFDASYFGEEDMSHWSDYATKREFWKLEKAKGAFEQYGLGNDVLPYNNYPPMHIENGDVFVIAYHTRKGTIDRKCYIADGTVWQGMPSTRQILVEDQ